MKRVKILFINVAVLTFVSLLMRTAGISFQVYLSNKIGPAGIGLFQLVMSVYYLGITFAVSGIRLAVTRLVAEEAGVGNFAGAVKSVRLCLVYGVMFGTVFSVVLFLNSQLIGTKWLGDCRTILSLRILAVSLPLISLSSVLSGYFTAVRRTVKSASVQTAEQIIKISVTVALLPAFAVRGIEYACAAVAVGTCTGEIASFLLLFTLYRFDIRRLKGGNAKTQGLVARMLKIALPVALSAYVTAGFRTLHHLLVPYGLKKSGASSESALSSYGMIHGMVLPVLMFPSVLLDAVSEIIVPELAECKICGMKKRLDYIVGRVLRLGIIASVCIMCIFIRYSERLGFAIFKSTEAAFYIRILALIIPVMYLDSITDGMLKGIGEQISSMRYNIIDSLASAALIYILLPRYAVAGYIFTVFFARILNFVMSINRLVKKVNVKIRFSYIIKAFICIGGSIVLTDIFLSRGLTCVIVAVAAVLYFLLLRLTSCLDRDDIAWIKSFFR